MKLLVGLGNPGKQYENTRHNMGFIVLDQFAALHNILIDRNKFQGLYGEGMIGGQKVVLLKPQSFINLSGEVVRKYIDYFKVDLEDILIIHDDLDLSFGHYKLKPKGSSGGHNGLKNIELHLGTQEYRRLKIGISNDKKLDTKDYVLGHFTAEDQQIISELQGTLQPLLNEFLTTEFSKLMSLNNNN